MVSTRAQSRIPVTPILTDKAVRPIPSKTASAVRPLHMDIEKCIEYSKKCSLNKLHCDDSVTENQMEWLKTYWQDIGFAGKLTSVLEGIRMHVQAQALPDLAVARLLSTLFGILDTQPVMERIVTRLLVAMMDCHRESVLDELVARTDDKLNTTLVLSVIEAVGCREGARLIARILETLKTRISEISNHIYSIQHGASAAFTIQVIAYHLARQLPESAPYCQQILELIERYLLSGSDEGGSLLGCELVPCGDEVYKCSECSTDGPIHLIRELPEAELSAIDKFRCKVCSNIFSSNCSQCASCPVESCCWGCGYRLIAVAQTGDESFRRTVDERLLGAVLVLSAIECDGGKKFTAEFFAMIDKGLGISFSSSKNEKTFSLSVSDSFASNLFSKLVLKDRMEAIGLMVVRALLAAPPTAPGLRAMSHSGPWPAVGQAITGYAWSAISTHWQSSRIQTAALSLLTDPTDLVSALQFSNSFSAKKMIVKRLFCDPVDVSVVESVIAYIVLEERWETEALFDTAMEGLNGFWKSQPLSQNIRDHFSKIFGIVSQNVCLGDSFLLKVDAGVVVNLFTPPLAVSMLLELREDIDLFLPLIPDLLANGDLKSVLWLVWKSGEKILTQNQVRTVLVDTVLPGLVRGGSATVRASAMLLAALAVKKYVCYEQTVLPAIERFEKELPEIRSFWVLSSIVEIIALPELVDKLMTNKCPVGAVSFMASNPTLSDSIMSRPEFDLSVKESLASVRTLDALIHIMESAIRRVSVVVEEDSSSRPDGGVRCRQLSKLFPVISSDDFLFSKNAMLSSKSLKAIGLMDRLGIVNRRSLLPLLFARYVLSVPLEIKEDIDDDTVELNALAWEMFKKIRDPNSGFSPIIPAVISIVKRMIGDDQLLASNSAFRLSQTVLFAENARKDDMRNTMECLMNELEKISNEHDGFSAFIVACVLNAVSVCPDLKPRVEERANGRDAFSFEFLAAELAKSSGSKRPWERFETTTEIVKKFMLKTLVVNEDENNAVEDALPVRAPKRRRSSTEKPQRQKAAKKLKRKSKPVSDHEYTDGGPSDDQDDAF
jgi:hypothetical protein